MTDAPFTELRSPRLLLRRLRQDDAAALCAYRSLPEVARYQSWESFSPEDATRLIDDQAGQAPNVPGTWFQLAIVSAATDAMIGDCGLHTRQDDPRQVELGITLDPAHQGRGYAAEALACVLACVFGELGKRRASAVTDAENDRAAALFRRLGFRQEAHFVEHLWFKGRWGSEFTFALLRREWEQWREPSARRVHSA